MSAERTSYLALIRVRRTFAAALAELFNDLNDDILLSIAEKGTEALCAWLVSVGACFDACMQHANA